MDPTQIIEVSIVLLAALALSAVCIRSRPGKADFLCGDCRFNAPDLCLKTDRPEVTVCTSYRQNQ